MVKAINIKSTVVKVPFVDDEGNTKLELSFDKKDITEQKITDLQNEMLKNVALMSNQEEKNDFEQLKTVMTTVIDGIFGEGSFDKLYELSPSWSIVLHYFIEMIELIKTETENELSEMQSALNKYVK